VTWDFVKWAKSVVSTCEVLVELVKFSMV